MSGMLWVLFLTPVLVLLLGVRVVRYRGRYRGRHLGPPDVGVDIFEPHSNCRCVVVPAGTVFHDVDHRPVGGTVTFTRTDPPDEFMVVRRPRQRRWLRRS